jgi:Xaa-Pro aminopeptidase
VDHHLRRRALAARLDELEVDAMLVTRLPNTRYLTGFTGSNGCALIGRAAAVFLTDGRYTEQSRREVPDVDRVTFDRSYRGDVAERCASLGISRLGVEADDLTILEHRQLVEALGPGVEVVAFEAVLEDARAVKDEDERAQVRAAQAATDAAFEAVLDRFVVGASEQQIARELDRALRDAGADDLAFAPIVAFGESAAEPHHEPGHRMLEEGDIVKLDFGGLVGGYHADMTRTIAFGAPAAELAKVHDVVREAQQAGIDAVRAGASGSAVDAAARAPIAEAGYGDRFVHGLGHGVGLEIHERPWLGADQDAALPAGAIVTVEPGIYLPGIGGVRIEDMVEVTEDGGVVVGTSPRDLIEL